MTTRRLTLVVAVLALGVALAGAAARPGHTSEAQTEVVVTLSAPPLAQAGASRARAAARVSAEQRRFLGVLRRSLPDAIVRWRYQVVANGMAIVVPERAVPRLQALPGVREVFLGTAYRPALDRSPGRIGAQALWGPGLASAGQGVKIGIIDDGVDQRHPFFAPAGYDMPPGFPKGQRSFTTAKVIVARAFPPPNASWRNAAKPFDPELSSHATHVAGIAAGNADTRATGGRRLSGVAPRAYIGNYKALTIPTDASVGLDGNAPEIVAAIEAAVKDGMDVINLSIGEPEIEPSRDIVALALDAAAAAGVVPVVAAGNDFDNFGRGSVSSPGSSDGAITVAAASAGADETAIAGFSSVGPTPVSLRLKPDVTAPGVGILSSVPGGWTTISGTSMATPHVAGSAALLRQRHLNWTVAQIKAALVVTARPVVSETGVEPPTRAGAGLVDVVAADRPLVLAAPSAVSLGFLAPGATATRSLALDDAGGGAGTWQVTVERAVGDATTVVSASPSVTVPGTLTLLAAAGASNGEVSGAVTLTRDGVVRRVPYWLRVAAPALASAETTPLARPGNFMGDTRGRSSLVSAYRYPEVPAGGAVSATLAGPEQVYRVSLPRPVANFGVVVTSRSAGARVEPRVVVAGDESRLTGYTALPVNLNPYLASFGEPVLAAGAVRPLAGEYDVVFDSPGPAGAGAFSFRYWVDDVTPPSARLVDRSVRRGRPLRLRVADGGSGVYPASLAVRVDGARADAVLRAGVVRIGTNGLRPGRHALRVQISDYQETRNTENVARILPNTRVLAATVTVRR